MRRHWWTVALLLGTLLVAGGQGMVRGAVAADARQGAAAGSDRQVAVRVQTVKRRTVEDWRHAVGQLESFENPLISAEVAGKIIEVRVKEGEAVRAGDVLARIDDADYRLARDLAKADISRIQALLAAAQKRVRRVSTLVRKGSAPVSALDDASAQLQALQAQLRAARVRLQQAERSLGKTLISSPVDGRISARLVAQGDLAAPGKPLFRLSAPQRLKARLPFPERDLAFIRVGQPLELTTPARPGEVVKTTVASISPDIDPASRAAHVLAIIDNRQGWRPGSSVDGRVLVARRENVPVVPEKALVRRPAGTVVFIAGSDGRAHQRRVEPGLRFDGLVEIRRGLRGGERIVTDGAGFLDDGVAIRELGR